MASASSSVCNCGRRAFISILVASEARFVVSWWKYSLFHYSSCQALLATSSKRTIVEAKRSLTRDFAYLSFHLLSCNASICEARLRLIMRLQSSKIEAARRWSHRNIAGADWTDLVHHSGNIKTFIGVVFNIPIDKGVPLYWSLAANTVVARSVTIRSSCASYRPISAQPPNSDWEKVSTTDVLCAVLLDLCQSVIACLARCMSRHCIAISRWRGFCGNWGIEPKSAHFTSLYAIRVRRCRFWIWALAELPWLINFVQLSISSFLNFVKFFSQLIDDFPSASASLVKISLHLVYRK